jgi:hypothetical protein
MVHYWLCAIRSSQAGGFVKSGEAMMKALIGASIGAAAGFGLYLISSNAGGG